MNIDPRRFTLNSVTDTCSVWNVLSSRVLYAAAMAAGCVFCCTTYVVYECLHKPRKSTCPADAELQCRLRREQERGRFTAHAITIDDLQDPTVRDARLRLDKGELSCLSFALRTGLAMLTDDQEARNVGHVAIGKNRVQTTPWLLGWLFYTFRLSDGDMPTIISQHEELRPRPLTKHLKVAYEWAMECRLMSNGTSDAR